MKKSLYKLLINWYQASDKVLPEWLERACESDTSLASAKCAGDDLTFALKKRPNDSTPIAGDNMASRVLRQIAEEDYLTDREFESSSSWTGWVRAAGMAAAVFTIALVGYQYLNTDSSFVGEDGGAIVVAAYEATNGVGEDLLAIGGDWKNPLDQEIEYIVSDAKGALGFLATSFVPSSYLKKAEVEKGA